MATTTWFAGDDSCARGYVREDHVVVRLWSDKRGATLRRATCLPSSGRAESWLQRLLASETGQRLRQVNSPTRALWWPDGSAGNVLAEEVASALDRMQAWRDWADWLWRHGDARGTRIELGEALDAARGTAREARLLAEIEELERAKGWEARRQELIWESAALQRAGEAKPRLRLEHGQLVGFHGALAFQRGFAPLLHSLGELRTCIHDRPSFEQLIEALKSAPIGGLVSLTIDLERALDPDHGAELINAIHRGLPRLSKLVIQSHSSGAALLVGDRLVRALKRLLTRQREPLHWGALNELELPLDVPATGWEPTVVDDLCAALGPSALERLRMSGREWPTTLTRWMRSSGFEERLIECRLIERQVERRRDDPVVVAVPKVASPSDQAELAVWADWLSSHGDPLGELALLFACERPDAKVRERIAVLQAEITSRLAAGRPEALVLNWNGPLLERVEVRGDHCPWPVEVVERVLASPAAGALAQLRVTGIDAATIREVVARLAAERKTLSRLEIEGRVAIASVLDSLPALRELQIGEPDLTAQPNRPHPELRELGVVVGDDWGVREIRGLFARLVPELLPGLTRLSLNVRRGRGGAPIRFTRLRLAAGARLRVIGHLRSCDYDELRRWSRANRYHEVELG
jgi:hypothetical protein